MMFFGILIGLTMAV